MKSGLFLLFSLARSTTSSFLLLSKKFLLFSLDKIDRKEKSTLCELRAKGEMMDVKPHTWQSRWRAAFSFSSLSLGRQLLLGCYLSLNSFSLTLPRSTGREEAFSRDSKKEREKKLQL